MYTWIVYIIVIGLLAIAFSAVYELQKVGSARKTRDLFVDLIKRERLKTRLLMEYGKSPSDRQLAQQFHEGLGNAQERLERLIPELSRNMWNLGAPPPPMKPLAEQWTEVKERFSALGTGLERSFLVFFFRKVLRRKKKNDFQRKLLMEINEV